MGHIFGFLLNLLVQAREDNYLNMIWVEVEHLELLYLSHTINFPNTTVGNTSNYNLTIYSTGTATLTIDSITVPGSIFSFNPLSFPINIPAGGSQDVTVNFTPATYAYYQGLLKIYCNDPVNLVNDVNLLGQGVLSGARIGLSATSHNFGNVWVGEEGIAFWNFKVFNMGDQTLQISDLHFNLPEYTYNAPATPFQIFSTDTSAINGLLLSNASRNLS